MNFVIGCIKCGKDIKATPDQSIIQCDCGQSYTLQSGSPTPPFVETEGTAGKPLKINSGRVCRYVADRMVDRILEPLREAYEHLFRTERAPGSDVLYKLVKKQWDASIPAARFVGPSCYLAAMFSASGEMLFEDNIPFNTQAEAEERARFIKEKGFTISVSEG